MRRTICKSKRATASACRSRLKPSVCCHLKTERSMTAKQIRIAQISDLHIKPPGTLAYGRVDTAKALERCVAALNAFQPEPDFVVISGDLVDTPNAEEYEHLKRLLAPLKWPFAAIPGNHDSRELMRAAFPNAPYTSASGALNQKT